jgi:hypothetical protein
MLQSTVSYMDQAKLQPPITLTEKVNVSRAQPCAFHIATSYHLSPAAVAFAMHPSFSFSKTSSSKTSEDVSKCNIPPR